MSKLFNIAALAVAASAVIHVKSADGELLYADEARTLPMRIHVHSPGSKAYGVVEGRQSTRAVKRMNDNEGKVTVAPTEERRQETAEDLAAITILFENFTYGDGSLQGAELFEAAYADPGLGFITKQVAKFVGDWGNFKSGSAAS